jgi:hypothetical protein
VRHSFKAAGIAMLAVAIALASFELLHHRRFGHFVQYGTHTDIIITPTGANSEAFHLVRLLNLSFSTIDIEGCRMGGGYAGNGIFYDFDVQKWDTSSRQWLTFRGADTWDADSSVRSFSHKNCASAEITHIRPLTSEVVAATYTGWTKTADPIRVVVYTPLSQPPEKQRRFYTEMFINTCQDSRH